MPRTIPWNTLLPACLAALLTVGVVRGGDDKATEPPSDGVDKLIYANLKEVINHGANLYNSGDWNGCYRLWEGALMSIKPLLAHRGKLQEAIDGGIANARQDPLLYRRAWVLRSVLDQVRADIRGQTPAVEPEKKDKDQPAAVVAPPKEKTLWDRLGGEAGVTRLVDEFINAVVADPKIDFYRQGDTKVDAASIAKMKRGIVEQVSQATGGPLKYTGPDVKKVHKEMGITNDQFDAALGHLQKTLEKHKVAGSDKKMILAVANGMRKAVVQPKKPGDKKPEDKKPDVKNPGDKKNDDKNPDVKKPDVKKPGVENPLDKKPDVKKPDVKKPDAENPQDKKPIGKIPEDKKPVENKPIDKKLLDVNPPAKKPAGAASIQGHIRFNGQPLKGGTIVFTSAADKVEGKIAEDGSYKADGVKPGAYPVSIDSVKGVAVPANYKDPKTSNITLDIKDGKQTFDLQLQ